MKEVRLRAIMASPGSDVSMKMSKTMSLAALRSRNVCSPSTEEKAVRHHHRHRENRRGTPTLISSARKRPRTTRGKPHSHPSALRSCVSAKREPPDTAFLPHFDPSFVKVEPADCQILHQVPTFFPHDQHLLICPSSLPSACELSCNAFPSLSSLSSPVSPVSSSPLGSSAADEYPGADDSFREDDIDFVARHDDSCFAADSFLGERFYEIERTISGIMGEVVDAPSSPSSPVIVQYAVPKIEADQSESYYRSELSNDLSSPDTCTTSTTQELMTSEDVDYRIDLTDFEPDQDDSAEADALGKRLILSLNYDDVITEWSNRGPLFADGSWTRKVPEGCTLDLAEWELDRVVPSAEAVLEAGMDGFQGVRVTDDGQTGEEDVGKGENIVGVAGSNAGREARVMRYREKRRTRLFSKKIRYEVRKLNAERRPRMKGRFIKRISE